MNVSVLIVNYNTPGLTIDCIESLQQETRELKYEIIVVDNASTDNSLEILKAKNGILVVESNENVGFGRANNLAAQYARGKYFLLLNSDTIVKNNALKIFFDYMENHQGSQLGCLGAFLLNPDGSIGLSYGRFPSIYAEAAYLAVRTWRHLARKKSETALAAGTDSLPVDYISGADIFLPSALFHAMKGFDPRFFLYYEETDLQKRIADAGYQRRIITGPQIVHLGGGSTGEHRFTFFMLMHASRSFLIYLKKHYSGIGYLSFRLFMIPFRFFTLLFFDFTKNEWLQFLRFYLNGVGKLEDVVPVAADWYKNMDKPVSK